MITSARSRAFSVLLVLPVCVALTDGCQGELTDAARGTDNLSAGSRLDGGDLDAALSDASSCTSVHCFGDGEGGSPAPVCGDGHRQLGEQCDDGNRETGDGCDSTCAAEPAPVPEAVCGDGLLDLNNEPAEECDDGNQSGGDGCDRRCRHERCGNERTDVGEDCDPPVAGECDPTCRSILPNCSDGQVQEDEGEECDDSNEVRGDGCNHCHLECGDDRLERDIDEECEPKYAAEATCDAETCKRLPLCGDGEIDTDVGEQCDPSNGADCIDCKFSLDAGDADAAISSPSCSSDLANVSVANGHFDVDISSWLLPNGTVTAAHQGVGADDPGSILVTYAAGSLPNASVNGVEQCVSIELGITYTLVARYSNPATNSEGVLPGISVKLYSGATCSGSFVSGSGPPVSNAEDTWVAFSRSIDTSIVAPSGSGAMLIQLGAIVPANTASGQMRYDGIALGSCGNCLIEQEAGEGCDDGNTVAGDGCSPTCQLECGNGTLQTPEQCDDGNLTFGDLCSPSCRTKTGCDSCVTTSCNPAVDTCLALDGVAQAGPARGRPRNALCSELRDCIHDSGCNLNTAIANGPTVAGEPVDPANPGVPENCYCGSSGVTCLESDAANGSCRAQIEAALETTDPNLILGRVGGAQPEFPVFDAIAELLNCEASSCAADCVKPITCGNGYVENRTQAFVSGFSFLIDRVPTPCDDQYTHSGSGCSFEECDDGNTNNGDGCDENCFLEACGNYLKQGIEECDDGNVLDEDGCHSDCTAEFICGDEIVDDRFEDCEPPNTGSVCSADEHDTDPASCGCDDHCLYKVCGNEIVQEGEECDPPNGASCDENCQRSVDDCTECMLRLDANQPCTQDLFNGNGIPNDPFGLGCLQDPLCLDLWDCERESLCFLEGLAACYCGPGADFSACERSTYVLTGECKDEMLAAFEEQWGRPPNNNIEMMDNFFQVPPAPSRGPLVNASYIVDTCLVPDGAFVTTLREQLTASGLSSQDVDTCMNACFP